jgi:hypothetical protein
MDDALELMLSISDKLSGDDDVWVLLISLIGVVIARR